MYKKRLFSISLALIAGMLLSAIGPTSVYADDDPPADPPPTETVEGETEEGVSSEEPGF